MVLVIGPDIADMGKCEQDDLGRVGRVREDLLIARDRCIETQFSGSDACGAWALNRTTLATAKARTRAAASSDDWWVL